MGKKPREIADELVKTGKAVPTIKNIPELETKYNWLPFPKVMINEHYATNDNLDRLSESYYSVSLFVDTREELESLLHKIEEIVTAY